LSGAAASLIESCKYASTGKAIRQAQPEATDKPWWAQH